MHNVGIVGHEAKKFTEATEHQARVIIRELLSDPSAVLVSGHCHLGGIDIWAEEEADALDVPKIIHVPEILQWNPTNGIGFRERNIRIATDSHVVYNIVVAGYPPDYKGTRAAAVARSM